ncbi:hypothetical protein CF386_11040 [Paraphotobacterium marinum]|uniref:Major facilitator superfamily (MFS) profile domain-containing protein n=2 Tax=Paraphotobacterium marinum TaxID=1755811 RepID=A0A220VHC8_9GAMM|nr:hypothetical protein CF386_11040 [Paraphotobacterium marinum]
MRFNNQVMFNFTLIIIYGFGNFMNIILSTSIKDIANEFMVSNEISSYIMPIFLAGYACGAILFGIMSHKLGRKNTMLIGCLTSLLGIGIELTGIYSQSIIPLFLGRFINGLGSSAGVCIALILIADTFNHKQGSKMLSLIFLVYSFVPPLLISLSGFVINQLNWHYILYSSFVFNIFVMILVFISLNEDLNNNYNKQTSKNIFIESSIIMGNKYFLLYLVLCITSSSVLFIYNAFSPFIAKNQYHISYETCGIISIIPCFGLLVGSYLSKKLINYIKEEIIISIGLILFLISSLTLFAINIAKSSNFYYFIITQLLSFLGLSIIMPISNILAIKATQNTSLATGLLNFLNFLACALILGLVNNFLDIRFDLAVSLMMITIMGGVAMVLLFKKNYS